MSAYPDSPHYSPAEQARLRQEFAPTAAKVRQLNRPMLGVVGLFLLATAGRFVLPEAIVDYVSTGSVLLGFAGIGYIFFRTLDLLRCPGCRKQLDRIQTYCPECASPSLAKAGWFSPMKCSNCGQKLMNGKQGRSYKIHACSSCGLYLDEQGL